MELGTFSVSLTVKNLATSQSFYEALGFSQFGGDPTQNWVILKNGATVIGLFQDMFADNILTFNPGWSAPGEAAEDFEDIRSLQAKLIKAGIEIAAPIDPDGQEPAHLILTDPDGNQIMLDQHVARPPNA